jgi:hypothetical protein
VKDKVEKGLIWRTSRAPTLITGARRVTPVAAVVGVRWPGGGYFWQFPLWVEVEEGEQSARLPIVDITRITLWLFQAITWLSIVLLALVYLRRRKSA